MLIELIMPAADFRALPMDANGVRRLTPDTVSHLEHIVGELFPDTLGEGGLALNPIAFRNYMADMTSGEYLSVVFQAAGPDSHVLYFSGADIGGQDDLYLRRLDREYVDCYRNLRLSEGAEAEFRAISARTSSKLNAIVCVALCMNYLVWGGKPDKLDACAVESISGSGFLFVDLGTTHRVVRKDLMSSL